MCKVYGKTVCTLNKYTDNENEKISKTESCDEYRRELRSVCWGPLCGVGLLFKRGSLFFKILNICILHFMPGKEVISVSIVQIKNKES